ncbi:MAG TPA: hypothetical protein VFE35_03110 [Candidatus Cybelea sp.]|nr:hypothetical protein [Candidatus Cybelea sp.]
MERIEAVVAADVNADAGLANFGRREEYRREFVAAVAALQAAAERLKTKDKRSNAQIVAAFKSHESLYATHELRNVDFHAEDLAMGAATTISAQGTTSVIALTSAFVARMRDPQVRDILEACRWDGTTALMRRAYDAFVALLSEQQVA